jgi:hypothetical protein
MTEILFRDMKTEQTFKQGKKQYNFGSPHVYYPEINIQFNSTNFIGIFCE